jgi:hypothetical protein
LTTDTGAGRTAVLDTLQWARQVGYLVQTQRGHRLGDGRTIASQWQLTDPSQQPRDGPRDESQGPDRASQGPPTGTPEVSITEVSSKTPYVSTGSASVAANGGREPHKHEPNARRAIAALIRDRTLPFTVEQLLELAYALGNGDPWNGYLLRIKAATEQSFAGARDPTRVLHKRLELA